jgi:NADH dehydrogenase
MILVVGATGLLGGLVTRQLLERGEQVRILVRNNSPSERLAQQGMATAAKTLIEAGAQPVVGDLKDPASLQAACAGVQTVITTANSAVRGGDDNPETVEKQGNRNLIEAARKAGVGHFIFVSAHSADPNSPVPFLAGKGQTDEYLQASGLPYTIIAPNAFMDSWIFLLVGLPVMSGQPVSLVGSGARKHSFIAMADVAAFNLACVNNPKAINQRLLLGGPEAISFREAVSVYEHVLGKPIEIRSVPPGEPLPNLSPGALAMAAAFDAYDSPIDMSLTAAEYGVSLTPLETFVRQMMQR